ncbi:RteC domain-containing protein [Sunxiuqinia indica]|uniref:RteC domain-containing protein n=1 Tax=Sunxiuqinia indica TaxID=2692584 RepID=UPI00135C0550|nr:RteC domain-containing protein [Sunxiuqinia indica]
MKTYCEIIFELERQLSRMKDVSDSVTEQMEYAIGHCKIALENLRELVIEKGFPDHQSEIKFFKQIKPAAYGKLLFYRLVFNIESKRKNADISVSRRYLQKCLYKIDEYMDEYHVKVQYYRCGFKHLDEQYFLRDNSEIPLELKNSRQLLDEKFFTWHDHTFSVIMANEMLADYIHEEIEKLEYPRMTHIKRSKPTHYWSGKKIDLAEMAYALHYARLVDNGKTSIRELADLIGGLFGIELGKDIYRLHTEIQQRKIDRTKFLEFLQSVLRQRLDDDDK